MQGTGLGPKKSTLTKCLSRFGPLWRPQVCVLMKLNERSWGACFVLPSDSKARKIATFLTEAPHHHSRAAM